jgi:hypothetical protein
MSLGICRLGMDSALAARSIQCDLTSTDYIPSVGTGYGSVNVKFMEDMMAQKPEDPKIGTPDKLVKTAGVELAESELDTVTGGKASPVLMQACATGTHLKEATITG